MAVYEKESSPNNGQVFRLREQHIYGSTRLGMRKEIVDLPLTEYIIPPYALGNKRYEITNHLGNVMATINDRKTPVDIDGNNLAESFEPTIITARDYYPFGLEMLSTIKWQPMLRNPDIFVGARKRL